MKTIKTALAIAILMTAGAAQADNGYMIFGMQKGAFSAEGTNTDFDQRGMQLGAGVQINDGFAIEGRMIKGIGGDRQTVQADCFRCTDVEVTTDLNYAVSVFAKPQINFSPNFAVYGLAGMTQGSMDVTVDGWTTERTNERESGFSYGAGISFSAGDGPRFNVEHVKYMDKPTFEYSATSLNIQFPF